MKNFSEVLKNNMLFKDLAPDEIENIMKSAKYRVIDYDRGSIIALEDEECSSLGIVLEGCVEIQKIYVTGKVVTLTQLRGGNIFGEAIVFSKLHKYPSSIAAIEASKILYIARKDIIDICSSHPSVMENFMQLLSNRILMLNKKLRDLSFETIRQKICSFLLEQYKKQKSLTLRIPLSRKAMAEHMGIQRPSLSRELINMREEGLIEFDKKTIRIRNIQEIEEFLV